MSIASRLFNIARAEVEERLRRLEERHNLDSEASEATDEATAKDGRSRSKDSQQSRHSARSSSGQDPDMARWYANLEVPYGSDFETVQAAWKKLVRNYHPDRHGHDPERQATATEILKELNNAYEQLKKRLDKS